MTKKDIIQIADSMGFILDYDQWKIDDKCWLRFILRKPGLDERDLRLIWWKDCELWCNLQRAAEILFKAGQKAKIQQLNQSISL